MDSPVATAALDEASGNFQAVDPAGGAVNITLPLAANSNGLVMWIGNVGTDGGSVRIIGPGNLGDFLNGETALVVCDGSTWQVLSKSSTRPGINVQTLTGNLIMQAQATEYQQLDPGGSNRIVTLPFAGSNPGRTFLFSNFASGAETLDLGGVVTIGQNESVRLVSDGSAYQHMGVVTIALS